MEQNRQNPFQSNTKLYSTLSYLIFTLWFSMEYWDEAGERPVDENTPPEMIIPIFSTKRLILEGVSFYSEEFASTSGTTPVPGFHQDELQVSVYV